MLQYGENNFNLIVILDKDFSLFCIFRDEANVVGATLVVAR